MTVQGNVERKAEGLERKISKQHDWRVQTWAQAELAIREANAAREVLGYPPVEPFKPDFEDENMLRGYAERALSTKAS